LLQEAHDELERRVEERTAELAQMNEQLRQSERRYKTLVDASPSGIITGDLEGRITFASRRVLELRGIDDPRDLYGRDPLEFVFPEDHDKFREGLRIAIQDGLVEGIELRLLRKDGSCFFASNSVALLRDDTGRPIGIVAVIRDITERKKAQEALKQANEELQAIYDGILDGLVVADVETQRLCRANASFCAMLGYSEDEIPSLSVADVHPPYDLPMVQERFRAQAEGRLGVGEDMPVLRKDGSVFSADVGARRFVHKGRDCLVAIFRDITDRKKAQEALEREHRALRRMLHAQDRERQLVSYDLHDGVAQHLTAAMMHFQACKPGEVCAYHDPGLQMLERAMAESRRLISGLRPPILDDSGIVAAIAHIIHDLRAQGGPEVDFRSNVTFDRLEPTLENSLYRIVQEGLTNAHQHAKVGRVRVELIQKDDTVVILVEDHGIGFDPTLVDERRYGLAGIRERARVLGGNAVIESAPGKGTRIQVDLPLVLAAGRDGSQ
jgi:two-component system sensor histidine kinase UhpB